MTVLTLAVAINPSYSRWMPSICFISTVYQCHRRFRSTVMQAGRKYPNLDEYYHKNACKFWDNFYKRHKNKFFKDRHYLEKDWGQYFSDDAHSPNGKVVLEVGCGAGNTIFPLIASYPKLYVQACDISPHAVALVKSHALFKEDRVNAFVCDVTVDNLLKRINPSSVDVITLIFMLSAVSPYKMPSILRNIKRVLKPDGYVLLRDYAVGDFAQVKLENKNQMITEGYYVRGDGTCSFYFSKDFLSTLFFQAGFNTVDISIYCKQIKNCRKNITMDRCILIIAFAKMFPSFRYYTALLPRCSQKSICLHVFTSTCELTDLLLFANALNQICNSHITIITMHATVATICQLLALCSDSVFT